MSRFAAVFFDRDGTLVEDVPYNTDPDAVRATSGALEVVSALRAQDLLVGVITNQSGVARGVITCGQLTLVNERIDRLFGGFDVWSICPHGPDDGCNCRKPAPGLVIDASTKLGVAPRQVLVVGDRLADIEAAGAAGACSVLVPSPKTEPAATARADHRLSAIAELLDLVGALG